MGKLIQLFPGDTVYLVTRTLDYAGTNTYVAGVWATKALAEKQAKKLRGHSSTAGARVEEHTVKGEDDE